MSKKRKTQIQDEAPLEVESSEQDLMQMLESDLGPALEEEGESFLPEVEAGADVEADVDQTEAIPSSEGVDLEGTELDAFEAAEIEETEFIEDERLESIIESILFASDRPVGLGQIKMVFKGTNIKTDKIKRCLERLQVEYAGARRGVTLEEVPGGWQLRTKVDNLEFLRRTLKTRSFRLSGPALEVLAIVAYKQPVIKHEIDEIRGIESGHLLRALMEKGLVTFEGKSDLPGRPMQYGTTRRFLEIFGLRNLNELPSVSQIDELLPEGIGDEAEIEKPKLADVTESMAESVSTVSYSTGEDELQKIQDQLEQISTSSDFFEQEKLRQKQQRDKEKAQNIRDALAVGETVPTRDLNWLKKYDEALAAGENPSQAVANEDSSSGAGAEVAGPVMNANEVGAMETAEGLFEEDAPHPEDELPLYTDDEDEEEGEGEAHV